MTIFKKALVVAGGTGVAQLTVFLSLPILSRLYQPSHFGEFALFSSICWIAAVIATLQIEHVIVLPKADSQARRLMQLVFASGGIVAVLLGLLMFTLMTLGLVSSLAHRQPWLLALLSATAVMGITATQVLRAWHVRLGEFAIIARGTILSAFMTAAIAILLAGIIGGCLLEYGLMIGQSFGLFCCAAYWYLTGKSLRSQRRFQIKRVLLEIKAAACKYISLSLILTGSNLVKTGYGRLPTLTVNAAGGAAAAGYFGLVERVISAPTVLLAQAVASAFRHHVSKAASSRDHATVLAEYWSIVLRAAIFAIPVFAFASWIAPSAFALLFGEAWREAGEYASILIVGEAFTFVLTTVEDAAVLLGKNLYRLWWHVAQLILAALLFFASVEGYFSSIYLLLWVFVIFRIIFSIVDLAYFLYSLKQVQRNECIS